MIKLIITLLILIIILISTLFISNNIITGNTIQDETSIKNYSYTKAICDNDNFCQDNIIKCYGNKTISITPLTGAVVQFGPDWKDPRSKYEVDRLCD